MPQWEWGRRSRPAKTEVVLTEKHTSNAAVHGTLPPLSRGIVYASLAFSGLSALRSVRALDSSPYPEPKHVARHTMGAQ